MKKIASLFLLLLFCCSIGSSFVYAEDRAADPGGTKTGNVSDISAAKAGEPLQNGKFDVTL